MKKEETDSKIENIQILGNALNNEMFEDDGKSFLVKANQVAVMFSIKN